MELNELFRTTTSKLLILIFAKEKKASSLRYGRPECIALLLSFGADVDVRGGIGCIIYSSKVVQHAIQLRKSVRLCPEYFELVKRAEQGALAKLRNSLANFPAAPPNGTNQRKLRRILKTKQTF